MSTIPEQLLIDGDGKEFYYPPRPEVLTDYERRILATSEQAKHKLEEDERITFTIAGLKERINQVLIEATELRAELPHDPMIVYWDYRGTKFNSPRLQTAFDKMFRHRPGPKPGQVVLKEADYKHIYEPYYAVMAEYMDDCARLRVHNQRLERFLKRKSKKTKKIGADGSMI